MTYTILRNGRYFENHSAAFAGARARGHGWASGEGLLAPVTRADYAAAVARVLRSPGRENKPYELAGDGAYTRSELAAELSRQTGKTISYQNLQPSQYEQILAQFLPAEAAHAIADAESKVPAGALNDSSRTLSRLIGRPTVSMPEAVAAALRAL